MRRHFLLPVILFMLFVTGVQAQTSAESSPVPFSISSINSSFALAGTFEGEYRVRDDSIEITISSASVYLRNYGSYHGRRELSFISVGLASATAPGRWKVISHSRAVPVGETMKPGDRYLAEEKMRFSIPLESSLDLTKCWLLVEMGEITLDSDFEGRVGYALAQSSRDIFSPMLAKVVEK
jgi:hypothetical protein